MIKKKIEKAKWLLRYKYHSRLKRYYTNKMCMCSGGEKAEVYARKAAEHLKVQSDMVSQLLGIVL